MRKLSEIKGAEAIVLMADMVEPAAIIMGDGITGKLITEEKGAIKAIKHALKHHTEETLQIMAALDGVDIDDKRAFKAYKEGVDFLSLPSMLLEVVNDQALQDFFISQAQKMEETPSTPASQTSKE